MQQRYFITGTDTNIGKTYISVELLNYFNRQGYSTAALKPIASGSETTPSGLRNSDAVALQQAASMAFAYEDINPITLQTPISPNIIIEKDFPNLRVADIIDNCHKVLESDADIILVEGVGGWYAPVNGTETIADIAITLQFPVILVVGIKLGCLSHSLLSYEAIYNSQVPIAGWIANCLDDNTLAIEQNIDTIERRLPIPLLATVPWRGNIESVNHNFMTNKVF